MHQGSQEGMAFFYETKYEKPIVLIEHYALTQTIAACTGIKILSPSGIVTSADVMKNPDSTIIMKTFARQGGFLGGCEWNLTGETGNDGICYHTNINAAFTS